MFALLALGCGGRKLDVRRDGATGGGDGAASDGGRDAPAPSPDASHDADASDAPSPDGAESCGVGAAGLRPCRPELNQRCGHACGQVCVDLARDPASCGACGAACSAESVCVGGACQTAPTVVVPAAPGCLSIDIVHENGQLTWADLGHGTIRRLATSTGAVTTLASNLALARINAFPSTPFTSVSTVTPILVRDGTVYFIGGDEPIHTVMKQAQLCRNDGDGGQTCMGDGPFLSVLVGGSGATIQAVTPGSAPKTLLSAALAPTTWMTAAVTAGLSGRPPIGAIALSPDGKVLYFAAGGTFYSIPSTGAASSADVTRLGPTQGDFTLATALVTDGRRLVFPAPFYDEWISFYDLAAPCDVSLQPAQRCPAWVGASHVGALEDTLVIRDGWLYWSNGSTFRRGELSNLQGNNQLRTIAYTADSSSISGFDVGPRYAYLGSTNWPDGYIQRAPFDSRPEDTLVLARGQKTPRAVVYDGARIYWTTDDCDIKAIADPP